MLAIHRHQHHPGPAGKVCSRGIIDVDKERMPWPRVPRKLSTKTPAVQQAVGNLSGGNQQKVLLAKWMFADPDILILDEPPAALTWALNMRFTASSTTW